MKYGPRILCVLFVLNYCLTVFYICNHDNCVSVLTLHTKNKYSKINKIEPVLTESAIYRKS